MSLVVQKFGGTSVADPERLRAVADHVARTIRRGDQVVVVVSAMGKETDELIRLAEATSSTLPGREMDMLLSAGERKAMHNLALYYFEGTGGAKDMEMAAQWFRKAADLGVVDSQYNLAKLYDAGYGVPKNPAEAYKWYLIAARSGDGEAMAAAAKVKPELSPQAAAAIEQRIIRPVGG